MQLLGIHHLTAVSARIPDNRRFYTETLGRRLVKRSVNQDDVSAFLEHHRAEIAANLTPID